jgi:endonuclease YncB( thermonuclease family)
MKRFPLLLLAALLFYSVVSLAQSKTITGRIVRVIDGDTVILREADGLETTVRLQGIDAPEMEQPYGEEAKKHLIMLALDKEVTADCPKKDQYGRLVCKVITADRADVGQAMLWGGLAWHYKFYQNEQTEADRTRYASAEDFAREGRAGLWADVGAQAPWDYRQTVKNVREEITEHGTAQAGADDRPLAAAGQF